MILPHEVFSTRSPSTDTCVCDEVNQCFHEASTMNDSQNTIDAINYQ